MRTFIATAIVLSAFGASLALAQGSGVTADPDSSFKPPAGASPNVDRLMQAPIGHRQPRADQVPSNSENAYKESPEDKALDRKIKSICRGC